MGAHTRATDRGRRAEPREDRFDRVPSTGRVGAHRYTARPRYVWHYLIAGFVATVLLVTAGVIGLGVIGTNVTASSSLGGGPAQTKTEAVLDPEATVAILNGTEVANLAAGLEEVISGETWGTVMFAGNAASTDVTISAVFYLDPVDEARAAGLAENLGGVSVYQTEDYADYGVELIVLLGADYAGPGRDEAAAITARNEEAAQQGITDETFSVEPELDDASEVGAGF